MSIKPLFFANWKMNKSLAEAKAFCDDFVKSFVAEKDGTADVGIAPPLTALSTLTEALCSAPGILVGAQNVHWLESGAHTGEVSAEMIKELGASFAIVGHSERRQFYGETDECVAGRAKAAIAAGLSAVVCVGELKEQFERNETQQVVEGQLRASLNGIEASQTQSLIVAYEPVWAIGTGLAATPEIAGKVHAQIRGLLCEIFEEEAGSAIAILYGGSTKPENIAELIAQTDVNGALVGGASLKPDVFLKLIEAGRAAAA